MSDQRFEHAVRNWLDTGSDRTPPAAVHSVLLAIKTTPQERDLRILRRLTPMTSTMRLAAAVAIVAILGVAALTFVNMVPGPGGPGPTTTPSPTIVPPPSPAATVPSLNGGLLAPGPYAYDGNGLRVIMTVPAGWEGGSFNLAKAPARELPDGLNLLFRQPTAVFRDPCAPEGSSEPLGPSVQDLVDALVDLPNVTAVAQADATIGGFSGTHLTFVVDTEGIECVMALYGQGGFVRAAENGQHEDLWILDVAGALLVIDAATYPETSAGDRAELQTIVDTLVIERFD